MIAVVPSSPDQDKDGYQHFKHFSKDAVGGLLKTLQNEALWRDSRRWKFQQDLSVRRHQGAL